MGTTGIHDSPAPGAARPSLLTAGTVKQGHNILDMVSPKQDSTPPKAQPRRLLQLAWLLLPMAAALAWYVSNFPAPATSLPPEQLAMATTAPVPVTAPAAASSLPAAEPAQEPTESPVTTIASAASDPFTALASNAAVDAAPAAKPSPAPPPPSPVSPPAARAAKAPAATPASKPSTRPAQAQPATSRVATQPKPVNASNTARAPSAVQVGAGKEDPDVELLSAIMKHLNDGGPRAATGTSSQTIADLVKSCQTRDAIETLLCQRRICEGSWGKAQACPIDLAPKTAASAR